MSSLLISVYFSYSLIQSTQTAWDSGKRQEIISGEPTQEMTSPQMRTASFKSHRTVCSNSRLAIEAFYLFHFSKIISCMVCLNPRQSVNKHQNIQWAKNISLLKNKKSFWKRFFFLLGRIGTYFFNSFLKKNLFHLHNFLRDSKKRKHKKCKFHPLNIEPAQDFLSCERPCDPLELAMICRIKIYLESYSTMSRTACGNCPKNTSDCFQPGCIFLDGFASKKILTANRNIPGPTIKVCQNDILVVDVVNGIPGLEANVHWHGQTVHETPFMDGTPMISQCPIPSRSTFQYKLRAAAAGTHFWQVITEAENGETGPLSGALIVRQPATNDPQRDLYDTDELLLVLTQLHGSTSSLLINGMNGKDIFAPRLPEVNPGKRHRLRILNVGGGRGCPITISIDNHAMELLSLDGAPAVTHNLIKTITLANGERADVIVKADQKPKSSYWIRARLGGHCDLENVETKAILPYQQSAQLPKNIEENSVEETFKLSREQSELAPLQLLLETKSLTEAPPKPDRTLVFGFGYGLASSLRIPTYTIGLTGLIGHVNNLSLTLGGSPLVTQPNEAWSSQAYCNSEMNIPARCNEGNICPCMHIVQLEKEETVEVILADIGGNDEIDESHVWHMHGHSFHVMAHSTSTQLGGIARTHEALKDIAKKMVQRSDTPPLKDNVVVPKGGVVVLQFQAKNPGYWLFREERADRWMSGLGVIFQVGRDRDIPTIPSDFPTCKSWVGPDFFLI